MSHNYQPRLLYTKKTSSKDEYLSVPGVAIKVGPGLLNGSYSGDITYYSPGIGDGSCGTTWPDNSFVAAMNAPQMYNGANPNNNIKCGQCIKLHGPKGSAVAKIVDTCPPCLAGSVDLSPAVFDKIAVESVGRYHNIPWSVVSCSLWKSKG